MLLSDDKKYLCYTKLTGRNAIPDAKRETESVSISSMGEVEQTSKTDSASSSTTETDSSRALIE